jgi:hypothetical protein
MRKNPQTSKGRPLAVDPSARSTSKTDPAFVARPQGAPVYHGFQILSDVVVDGFTFGKISRAGLVWQVSDKPYFREICPPETQRWGVWAVAFPNAMTSRENVRRNLRAVLPELKNRWEAWRRDSETM